jgi:hypothetical protein
MKNEFLVGNLVRVNPCGRVYYHRTNFNRPLLLDKNEKIFGLYVGELNSKFPNLFAYPIKSTLKFVFDIEKNILVSFLHHNSFSKKDIEGVNTLFCTCYW